MTKVLLPLVGAGALEPRSVLSAEREVKRRHIALAVKIKNLLTPEQLVSDASFAT